jgi:hypothetical protein
LGGSGVLVAVAVGVLVEVDVAVGSSVSVTAGVTVKTGAASTVPAVVAVGVASSVVDSVVGVDVDGSGVGSSPVPHANAAIDNITNSNKRYRTSVSSLDQKAWLVNGKWWLVVNFAIDGRID